jgi:hypothetical protein
MMADTIMAPVHPGEILLTEFLEPLRASQYQLAKAVDMPAGRITKSALAGSGIIAKRLDDQVDAPLPQLARQLDVLADEARQAGEWVR